MREGSREETTRLASRLSRCVRCVCVRERERERTCVRERDREREGERERKADLDGQDALDLPPEEPEKRLEHVLRLPVRVVHLERSTCHAISGQRD